MKLSHTRPLALGTALLTTSVASAQTASPPAAPPTQPGAGQQVVQTASVESVAAPQEAPATPVAVSAQAAVAAPASAYGAPMIAAPAPETPPVADAALPAGLPLKIGASVWSRYELRDGYADRGLMHPRLHREGDSLVSRARLSISTAPVDLGEESYVQAKFVPQAAYTMGSTGAPKTIADSPNVQLYEGYATVGSKKAKLDVGRFMMNYGGGMLIGNLGWNEAARAFQGARLHLTPTDSPLYIDVFATLINEGRGVTGEAISGDEYFYGVYAGVGSAIAEGLDLDAYLLGKTVASNESVAVPGADDGDVGNQSGFSDFTLGARVKQKVEMVDYRIEAGIQFGERAAAPSLQNLEPDAVSKFAYQADAEVGISPVKGFRFGLGGAVAAGDDPTTPEAEGWDPLYPTGHKFLGLSDVAGVRSDIASGNAHLSYKVSDALLLKLDGHIFSRMQENDEGESFMGSELDSHIVHPIGKGVVARAMYALFIPNEVYWEGVAVPGTAGDLIHFLEVQFGYNF